MCVCVCVCARVWNVCVCVFVSLCVRTGASVVMGVDLCLWRVCQRVCVRVCACVWRGVIVHTWQCGVDIAVIIYALEIVCLRCFCLCNTLSIRLSVCLSLLVGWGRNLG